MTAETSAMEKRIDHDVFRAMLDAAPDGILVCNKDGVIILANPQCEQMFGYSPQELTGQKIEILVPAPYDADHASKRQQYMRDPQKRLMGSGRNLMARNRSGKVLQVEIALAPVVIEQELCSLAIVRDMSEVRKLSSELEQRLEDLRRSNAELEQFAYVASHDLQEPLRMVGAYTHLLKKRYADKLDKEAAEYIDFAVSGVKRMQDLIQDLLEFSRVNTKGRPFSAVDLQSVIAQVTHILDLVIAESDARISITSVPVIKGDHGQMVQLFQNLLTNAVKFRRPDTRPVITISSRETPEEHIVTVQDNGIGIEQQHLDKIFEIFQRLHARDQYEGTGIGLAICKKIMERHLGRIWVESTPGTGTAFHLAFPREKQS